MSLARRRGSKKAAVAVGHAILVIAYHLLSRHTDHTDMGADYFNRRDDQHLTRQLVQRLEAMGYAAQLERSAA
jgi:transposase